MKNHKVGCELCDAPANMYCESDRASLCWRCDNKVHGANFLVAKHSRCVLCHHCQAVTPWTASGPKLPPSMSLCLSCATTTPNHNHNHDNINRIAQVSLQSRVNDDQEEDDDVQSSLYVDDDEEECSTDEEEEEEEDEDEEDNENQVVPLTFDIGCGRGGATPSSVEMSGCSSDETEEEDDNSHMLALLPPPSLKRKRDVFVSN